MPEETSVTYTTKEIIRPAESGVLYSNKEMFDRIEAVIKDQGRDVSTRFDRLETTLAQKADKADVVGLEGRVVVLELERVQRDKALEVSKEHTEKAGMSRQNKWAYGIGISGVIAAVGEALAQLVANAHH